MADNVTYTYSPDGWDQARFLALGGFTVVFLNYNKAQFIEQSVASALAQDFPLLEMFFMDDASTDGSGDTMERIVREYRGRHKVTVVRNATNKGITGQWNTVAKLATGNWFGMFCADDVAYPDRVTKSAEIAKNHPALKGFCTNGVEDNLITGAKGRKILADCVGLVQTGRTLLKALMFSDTAVIGATAFWHRSLFTRPLLPAPLDDSHLCWVLCAMTLGCEEPVWLLSKEVVAIKYTIGGGVSSSMRIDKRNIKNWRKMWLAKVREQRGFSGICVKTMKAVVEYLTTNTNAEVVIEAAKMALLKEQYFSGNTCSRILLLPQLIRVALYGEIDIAMRQRLVIMCCKRLILELFGLEVASFVRFLFKPAGKVA